MATKTGTTPASIPRLVGLLLVLLICLPSVDTATAVSLSSGSVNIGALTSYTVAVSGYSTNPTTILMEFSQWTPSSSKPYLGNSTFLLTSAPTYSLTPLTCFNAFVTRLQCNLPSDLASTFTLRITDIHNPSSSKPYPIYFIINSQNISATLTVTTPTVFPFQ